MATAKIMPTTKRIEFYRQFTELYEAGVPLLKIAETQSLWDRGLTRAQIHLFQESIRRGETLSRAMKASRLFPIFDLTVIEGAESSGQLEKIFLFLADRYEAKLEFFRVIKNGATYPLLVFVGSLFLFPFPKLIGGTISLSQYLMQTLGPLAALTLVSYIIYNYIVDTLSYPKKEPALSKKIGAVPVIGKLYNLMGLEEYFNSLALLTEAGVPIVSSCQQAVTAGKNGNIKKMAFKISNRLKIGSSLYDAFKNEPLITDQMKTYVQTGETTGELSNAFRRISDLIKEELQRKLKLLSNLIPKIIYGVIVVYMIYSLVQFQADRFKVIDSF